MLVPCEASPSNALTSLQRSHNIIILDLLMVYVHLVLLPHRCLFVKCNVPIHVGHQHIQGDSPLLIFINNLLLRITNIIHMYGIYMILPYHQSHCMPNIVSSIFQMQISVEWGFYQTPNGYIEYKHLYIFNQEYPCSYSP